MKPNNWLDGKSMTSFSGVCFIEIAFNYFSVESIF